MRGLRAWMLRLRGAFARSRTDRDFADELEAHLHLHIDDNLRAGMTPAEARRHALLRLGGVEAAKSRYRDRIGPPTIESLWRDVRFSVRLLRRSPGFAAAAIVPMALGIGATTTLFAVVNGVLLRPLPYAEAGWLIRAAERRAAVLSHALWMSRFGGDAVTRLVLGQVALSGGIGIVAGLLAAVVLSRAPSGLVFGIEPVDPATYVAGPLVVALTALLACITPLRRALRVHPAAVLRAE